MASLEFIRNTEGLLDKKNIIDLSIIDMGVHEYTISKTFIELNKKFQSDMQKEFTKKINVKNVKSQDDIMSAMLKETDMIEAQAKILRPQGRALLRTINVDSSMVELKITEKVGDELSDVIIDQFYETILNEFSELMGELNKGVENTPR